jgi:hypothetical protein
MCHFLDLPDYFYIEMLDYLVKTDESQWDQKSPDPIMALLYCFNLKLKYKLINLTPRMHIQDFNKNFSKQMLKLRVATFHIVPDFFPQTLSELKILKNNHREHEIISINDVHKIKIRQPFKFLPTNLTSFKAGLLHSSEFAVLPESLTYLNVLYVKYIPKSPIKFSLPNLVNLIVWQTRGGVHDFDDEIFNGIIEHSPENLEELSLMNFKANRINFVPSFQKLKRLSFYDSKFDQPFDLKFFPQTLTSLKINFDCVVGYKNRTEQQSTETLLDHLKYFSSLRSLAIHIHINRFEKNIMNKLPQHLTKFSFMNDYQDQGYTWYTYVRFKNGWADEMYLSAGWIDIAYQSPRKNSSKEEDDNED